ncbi:MAG: toprim domain-containing protein [Candidatus Hodarchaeaceae archaeon]|nr:toprim domain-containing protein [Candidatus Hodarchaeaceae archaeon]
MNHFEIRMRIALLTKETLEQIEELLVELNERASTGAPIIVEGTDDIRALKKLGVRGQFHKISGGKSLLGFVEGLAGAKDVIILTDFDRAGDKLAKFCAEHLKRLGIEPATEFREKLKSLVRRDVKDIEGLAKFLETQRAVLKN